MTGPGGCTFEVDGRSDRLAFEILAVAHAPLLAAALTDPRTNAFFDDKPANSDDLAIVFAEMLAGPGIRYPRERWVNYAVRHVESGAYIGRVETTLHPGYAEISYMFGAEHWGQGYGREAVDWLHAHAVNRHGVTAFWATVNPENGRSAHLLGQLGYARIAQRDWPTLASYDPGDMVFARRADSRN